MKKRIFTLLFGIVVLFSAPLALLAADGQMYTTVNIWYEKPMKIPSTNYHKGAMLPVGTKVRLEDVETKRIVFTDEHGGKYRIICYLKHHNVPGPQLAQKLFSEKNPMAKGGAFSTLTNKEKQNVKGGTIAVGMSKKAVIMAYGYPPTVQTPTTESNSWTYWKHRWDTMIVTFTNGKVSNIKD